MTTPQTDAPTLQERLRGPVAAAAQAYTDAWFNNKGTARPVHCIPANESDTDLVLARGIKEAADALDAQAATIAALVEALREAERKLQDAADYWDELCNDGARAPFTVAAKQARAALAKAAAMK